MNLYEILGIHKGARPEQVRQAFKARAQLFHPDKVTGDAPMFDRVREAYKILGNAASRTHYDETGVAKDMLPEETMARQKITAITAGMLQNAKINLDSLDIVESIKATLQAERQTAEEEYRKAQTQRDKVARMIEKLECDEEGDDQLIRGPMEDTLAQIDKFLLKTEADQKTVEVALEILSHHNQRKPVMLGIQPTMHSSYTTGTATSW